jgi:hypothetical protein
LRDKYLAANGGPGTYTRPSGSSNTWTKQGAGSTPTAVAFNGVTANGSSSQTTTQLTLTFSQAITGLTIDHITLSGVSGAVKGTLSGSGTTYTLGISGFTSGGTLSVSVSSPSGYSVSGSPKTVTIYRATQAGSNAAITIAFAQIVDSSPSIQSGITIYRSSTKTPTSATFTVANPSQYTNITWYINGTSVSGSSITIHSMHFDYYSIGEHFLTLEVVINGKPYTKRVTFKVAE